MLCRCREKTSGFTWLSQSESFFVLLAASVLLALCADFAASATHLMSQYTPDQRTESGAYQTVLIFDGLRVRDLFVVAFLPRNLDRTRLRLNADNLGGMGRFIQPITGNRTAGGHDDRTCNRAGQKRQFHRQFLIL